MTVATVKPARAPSRRPRLLAGRTMGLGRVTIAAAGGGASQHWRCWLRWPWPVACTSPGAPARRCSGWGTGGPCGSPALRRSPRCGARIVSIAESQIGYKTDPPGTYCNKYSAYWYSGSADCGNDNLDEEWCADFAAWVWKQAGAEVNYQYVNGDLNSSAASFYEWGVANGTWHPVGSGYVPQPGDVAVYGLNSSDVVAAHVAIVIGYQPGDRGPTAVNGDGDLTAFSIVEVRTDEYLADTHPDGSPLSGYVAPSYISSS